MTRRMSGVLTGMVSFALAATALAHDPEQMARAQLEDKLKEPWITTNGFIADFDKALETAIKDKKPVFAYFTISYMEDPDCAKVEAGVLSTPAFKKFGEGVVLFVHVDSGLPTPHADLLREKGGLAAPCFLVMDEQGVVTAKVESADVKGFEAAVKAGGEFAKLRAKADKTADEKVYVLAHEMDLGDLELQLAKERVAGLRDLTDAQRTQIDDAMMRLEIATAAAYDAVSLERTLAAGKRFAEMWAAGREPATDALFRPFFMFILDHAEVEKDAKLFKRALDKLKGRFGDKAEDGEWRDFFEEKAEVLKELEKAESGAGDKKDGNAK